MPKPNRSFNFLDKINADAQKQEQSIRSESSNRYIVEKIPVENILFNKRNTIFTSDDTDEDIAILADSIESIGLLDPIHVLRKSDGKFLLLAGEKRTKAYKLKGWRTIPAFIFDSLKDYEAVEILFQENLQNRYLDDRKRFLAFDELMSYHTQQLNKDKNNTSKCDRISKMLNVSTRTVTRLQKLRKNAAPDDMELLKQNKISFAEFKKRTNELIIRQQKENNARIAVLAQKAEPKKYIDENTHTVYYVGKDESSDNRYCSFMTNDILFNVGFHIPPLPYRTDINMAQVDLDILASNNLWAEYNGDLSEFRPTKQEEKSTETVSNSSNENTNAIEESSENTDETEVPVQSTIPVDKKSKEDEITVSVPANGADKEDSKDESTDTDDTYEDYEDVAETNNEIKTSNNEEKTVSGSSNSQEVIKDEKHLSNQISDFTGINLSGISVRGSLYAAPSGRLYILRNISFGENIGNGKFNVRCIAEEIDPETVIRNDI